MEDNAGNDDDDDIDFSIISPGNDKQKDLDFSVNELLENPQNLSNSVKQACQNPQPASEIKEGSFMKDLQKMQKDLSYESTPYDIYQPSEQPNEFTGTFEAKQEDTCTKTTNNMTKLCEKNLETDFRHLIVDFTEDRGSKLKGNKESFQDYFEGEILTTKKINQRGSEREMHGRTKSKGKIDGEKVLPSKILKNSSSKVSLVSKQRTKSRQSEILKGSSSKKSITYLPKPFIKKPTPLQSTSKQKSSSILNSKSKSKSKSKVVIVKQAYTSRVQSQAYSEYFGFESSPINKKKTTKKSSSKGKKIIYSNKNVNLYH